VQFINLRLLSGTEAADFASPSDSPFAFAAREHLKLESFDDYLEVIEHILAYGRGKGAVCLKTTSAYERTLNFERVTKEQARKAWSRPHARLRGWRLATGDGALLERLRPAERLEL